MPVTTSLGKRKRIQAPSKRREAAAAVRDEDASESEEDVSDIFRRAFEAKFKPLAGAGRQSEKKEIQVQDEHSSEESDWDGISEEEQEDDVLVVQHADVPSLLTKEADKAEKRAFMSAKPPSSASKTAPGTTKRKSTAADDDSTDASNLKHDLALQRLLTESHLLDGSDLAAAPTGRNRLKATELRLRSLGAKTSVLEQKRMPMAHRKGIVAKAARVEGERRREARENGIVLEKPAGKSGGAKADKRLRGIGGPTIGRFKGGTLSLSSRDVAGLSSSGRGRGGKRGGKRGGGRGGRR